MEKLTKAVEAPGVSRWRFLGYAGALAGAGMLTLQACRDDDDTVVPVDNGVNLGSGDVGILNYAYALEQLEAAFYTQVIASQYSGITSAETALLTDIRDHEVAHRNFFKAAITAAGATPIQDLEVDFSTIDFSSRDSVLGTAKTFEDLGVAAYNGAGKLIQSGDYLLDCRQDRIGRSTPRCLHPRPAEQWFVCRFVVAGTLGCLQCKRAGCHADA